MKQTSNTPRYRVVYRDGVETCEAYMDEQAASETLIFFGAEDDDAVTVWNGVVDFTDAICRRIADAWAKQGKWNRIREHHTIYRALGDAGYDMLREAAIDRDYQREADAAGEKVVQSRRTTKLRLRIAS